MKKGIFTFIMLLVLAFSSANAALKGDMNDDGKITIHDVRLLLQVYINGSWEEESTEEASGDFYLVLSDGVREYSTEDNDSLRIKLANSENPEGIWYSFKQGVSIEEFDNTDIGKGKVYTKEIPQGVFVWASINEKRHFYFYYVISLGIF